MIPPVAAQIADALVGQPDIRAMFLGGSHGSGTADDHSDIDFVIAATDGATDTVATHWQRALKPLGDIVLWRDRTVAPILVNAIVAPALRIDALILKPDNLAQHSQDSLEVLFDHDTLFDTLSPAAPPVHRDHRRMAYQFEEFIRILGFCPSSSGARNTSTASTG